MRERLNKARAVATQPLSEAEPSSLDLRTSAMEKSDQLLCLLGRQSLSGLKKISTTDTGSSSNTNDDSNT